MTIDPQALSTAREMFLGALEAGDLPRATAAARALTAGGAGHQLSFVRKTVDRTPLDRLGLAPLKVALLASFSIEFLHDALIARGFVDGLHTRIYQPGFGQFRQEILASDSGLYRFGPDVVVVALEGHDLAPALYRSFAHDGDAADAVGQAQAELASLLRRFRERSDAVLLVHNFARPQWPRLGILDGHGGAGQTERIAQLNLALQGLCRDLRSAYVVDYAGLVARVGAARWYDERMRHYARAPIAQAALPELASEYAKFFRALKGKSKKCLVLDLDGTLWGGVLGEDGLHGIHLGPTYPGSAYVAFQEAVLGLRQRGVILAIASKNNPADVDEAFASHPHMVLQPEHFAASHVTWAPKSGSPVAIAKALNIGLDALVFVDDSPVECEQIAAALPMVTVLRLPKSPEHYVATLLEGGLFETLALSEEDQRRGDLYRQRDQAEALREQAGSLEEFYAGLQMEVVFEPVGPASLARAAQLTQKTNQFNVTTVRYGEAELADRAQRPDWLVRTVRVRDRFGDNGIVGLLVARAADDALEVDTLLLSCRVIGRTVETAMLALACEEAARRELPAVRGRILITPKNEPVRSVYQDHGFHRLEGSAAGSTWRLDLGAGVIDYPKWLTVVGGE
jgi:FkbH-like protein